MMEDVVLFFGLSFCCAYAMVTAADSSAADAAMAAATAAKAATAVSGLSYYCSAVADAAIASAKK